MPYPTPPAPRIAYDTDGTVGLFGPGPGVPYVTGTPNTALPIVMQQAAVAAMNSDQSDWAFCRNWRSQTQDGFGAGTRLIYDSRYAGQSVFIQNSGHFPLLPYAALIFPRPMQLQAFLASVLNYGEGFFISPSSAATALQGFTVYTSTDTTNTVDGTWTRIAEVGSVSSPQFMLPKGILSPYADVQVGPVSTGITNGISADVNPNFRRNGDSDPTGYGWRALSGSGLRNVVGIKVILDKTPMDTDIGGTNDYNMSGMGIKLHLYGHPETSYDPNMLRIQSLAGGDPVLDMGDVGQGQSQTRSFKITNTSATLTANAVTLNISAPNAVQPTGYSVATTQVSVDGGTTWVSNLSLGNLAPGASTGTIQVRVTAPATNLLGVWSPRLITDAGSWS